MIVIINTLQYMNKQHTRKFWHLYESIPNENKTAGDIIKYTFVITIITEKFTHQSL